MPCYLLHMIEEPDRDAYSDPDVKDLVGLPPRFYCAGSTPVVALPLSEASRCLDREGPCWKPTAPGGRPAT